jgi:hypothetical protein
VKHQFDELLLGNLLTPVLAAVIGCIFGFLLFVLSRGLGFVFPVTYVVAFIGGAIVAGAVNFLLNVRHRADTH